MTKRIVRGEIYPTRRDGDIEIRVVLNKDEIVVKFVNTGFFTLTTKSNICSGRVKDKLKPQLYGVGYIGIGNIQSTESEDAQRAYRKWVAMLSRCYDPKSTSYVRYGGAGVEVCKEWHSFQNFANWYLSYKHKMPEWHLDKDLFSKGKKLYSPSTCCVIPKEINISLTSYRGSYQGDYVTGVGWDKQRRLYVTQLNMGKNLKMQAEHYQTEYEAWVAYKCAKESHLVGLAYAWKEHIAPEVFEALLKYKIKWDKNEY